MLFDTTFSSEYAAAHQVVVNQEPNELPESIESWFRDHEDGEFAILPDDHTSTVHGNPCECRTLVYTTKPHCLFTRLEYFALAEPVAMLGRPGLPSSNDLRYLRDADEQAARVFIGDADPPDLLIFAWLKPHVGIEWGGVSDSLLQRLGRTDLSPITVPMSDGEKNAVSVLSTFCPEFRAFLGPLCSALLEDGLKIELEGATMKPKGLA